MTDATRSFTRSLFAGEIHDDLIFPYPDSLERRDPAEAAVVSRIIRDLNALVGDVIRPEQFDEEETIPEEVIEAFARLGLLGISIPKEYGGLGLSQAGYARIFAAVAVVDPSLAVLVGVHCGLGGKAIALYGNAEQKARYLPMLARGETLAAYALTEPETGSDAQHIVTSARLNDAGTHWLLTGRKYWIGNGHRAGVLATFAQTPVERDGRIVMRPTAFIIRPDMPGFHVERTFRKLGIKGSTQAELRFDEMEVPVDHVLGEVGKGFKVAVHALNAGRLSLAAGCTQGTRQIMRQFVQYAEERVQFGKPLADFEITQRKLADMAADQYAADSMIGMLTALMSRDDVDASLEAACVKVFASELVWRASDEMVQLAGGRGFSKPWPYERQLRDARINRIFEGANEILRLFIALNGVQGPAETLKEVGDALKQPMKNMGLLSEFMVGRVKSRLRVGDEATIDTPVHARLQPHRRYFEKHVAELRSATDAAIVAHKKQLIDRQMLVERLSNMAIELFARACVISRTQRLLRENGLESLERELNLCDLFCVQSGRRFKEQRENLQSPQDATRRTIAADLRRAGGGFVPDSVLEVPLPHVKEPVVPMKLPDEPVTV
ncbi:MAG TPA: acyl-CoA dehydrogenase family protein [Gemmatimonadaceae bacterium]|nr:acyl-CoA dehydrogenase family protein [Gemmatimonadaceae bacterium]